MQSGDLGRGLAVLDRGRFRFILQTVQFGTALRNPDRSCWFRHRRRLATPVTKK
jgi:hypothetical protein